MAPVFTQVTYNPGSTGQFCEYGRVHRIGLNPAASLTEGRYMIDIDGKAHVNLRDRVRVFC
jgi:hypothetical protein